MKTPNIVLLILLNLVLGNLLSQNTTIHFSYDAGGNRVIRYPVEEFVQNDDDIDQIENNRTSVDSGEQNESTNWLDNNDRIELFFYPNPVKDIITLDLSGGSQQYDVAIEIYDNSGKLVRSEMLSDSESKIDVSSIAPGNYVLKARVMGERFKWKFIKQ